MHNFFYSKDMISEFFNDAFQITMEDGVVADMLAHGASAEQLPAHDRATIQAGLSD